MKLSEETNNANMAMVKKNWRLGPERASENPEANKPYWSKMAEVWQCEEEEARRKVCANCEYFDNSPKMMKYMDQVPMNKYDKDGGGRGYCHEFDFICHNLRTCQNWEDRPTPIKFMMEGVE